MTASALSRRALQAAVAVAARHGLHCDEPEILRDASNLLVRLHPAPVVARVSTVTSLARDGDAWFAREVAIAGHLAAAGAPVVPPSPELEPGPHHHDGLVLTFWTYVDEAGRTMDAHEAGRRLRECHDALETFPGELPPMGALDEAQAKLEQLAAGGLLADADAAALRRAGNDVRARIAELALPLQALHGDAHLHNVISGPDGPLWNDFEDTFLGPRGWDLGCLHAMARVFGRDPRPVAAAQAGYGEAPGDEMLAPFVGARRFQGTVWSVIMAHQQPGYRERSNELLAYYRERR